MLKITTGMCDVRVMGHVHCDQQRTNVEIGAQVGDEWTMPAIFGVPRSHCTIVTNVSSHGDTAR